MDLILYTGIYPMKKKHFIDSHKGSTFIFIIVLMAYFDQWDNNTAWAYLATHGLYGFLWVIKSMTFPDKQWEQSCGIGLVRRID